MQLMPFNVPLLNKQAKITIHLNETAKRKTQVKKGNGNLEKNNIYYGIMKKRKDSILGEMQVSAVPMGHQLLTLTL